MAIADAPLSERTDELSEEKQRHLAARAARDALTAEWNAHEPKTPDEILEFYRTSEHLMADLDAFHTDPERLKWTITLAHVARQVQARTAIDIGCGGGHDLFALAETGVIKELQGVEPNEYLANVLRKTGFGIVDCIEDADIENADLLSCFDVLEHVVNPEAFLGEIAQRARVGTHLLETCATSDCDTPLHLKENRGWRTGRVLERYGWEKIAEQGRLRVWKREATENKVSTSLILCAFRSVSLPTHRAIVTLIGDKVNSNGWRTVNGGEAGINRARSIAASKWWTETADDVFLMVDDDIVFEPGDANAMVEKCRNGYDVIAAAYPVRDGGHLAVRAMDDRTNIAFGINQEPIEMRHMSTGFFAVNRKVLDALIPTLTLCHANQEWAFWPIFDYRVIEDWQAGGFNYLSEDYNFCELVRALGFKVWLDPSIGLQHLGTIPITVKNMNAVKEAVGNAQ